MSKIGWHLRGKAFTDHLFALVRERAHANASRPVTVIVNDILMEAKDRNGGRFKLTRHQADTLQSLNRAFAGRALTLPTENLAWHVVKQAATGLVSTVRTAAKLLINDCALLGVVIGGGVVLSAFLSPPALAIAVGIAVGAATLLLAYAAVVNRRSSRRDHLAAAHALAVLRTELKASDTRHPPIPYPPTPAWASTQVSSDAKHAQVLAWLEQSLDASHTSQPDVCHDGRSVVGAATAERDGLLRAGALDLKRCLASLVDGASHQANDALANAMVSLSEHGEFGPAVKVLRAASASADPDALSARVRNVIWQLEERLALARPQASSDALTDGALLDQLRVAVYQGDLSRPEPALDEVVYEAAAVYKRIAGTNDAEGAEVQHLQRWFSFTGNTLKVARDPNTRQIVRSAFSSASGLTANQLTKMGAPIARSSFTLLEDNEAHFDLLLRDDQSESRLVGSREFNHRLSAHLAGNVINIHGDGSCAYHALATAAAFEAAIRQTFGGDALSRQALSKLMDEAKRTGLTLSNFGGDHPLAPFLGDLTVRHTGSTWKLDAASQQKVRAAMANFFLEKFKEAAAENADLAATVVMQWQTPPDQGQARLR